jgi:hypothetical protein
MKQFLNVLHVYNILLLGEKSVQALKVAMRLEPFSHSPILAAASRKSLKENRLTSLPSKLPDLEPLLLPLTDLKTLATAP